MYVCKNCGENIKKMHLTFVRCPKCGSRILTKTRPPVAKEVSTD